MSQGYRRFAVREQSVAESWATEVVSHLKWELGPPFGDGESNPVRVKNSAGLCGIAKPAFDRDIPRAAHEKIAADLAYLLDLPVPPVVLWSDPHGAGQFAISLYAFPQPLTWLQAIMIRQDPQFLANCLDIFAAGYVFHVWIGDTDHHANPGNVLVDAEASIQQPGLAFIDHANSMSATWTRPNTSLSHLRRYYIPYAELPRATVAKVAEWVQNMDSEAIEDIVRRIPVAFLSETRATLIVDCLIRRKAEIASFFEA